MSYFRVPVRVVTACVCLLATASSLPAMAQAGPGAAADQAERPSAEADSAEGTEGAPALDPAARDKAVGLVRQGNDRLASGFYKEALALFQQAYAIYPSPKLLFNLAQTLDALARPLEALEHYERFVEQVDEANAQERWAIAHRQIFELQGKIASVRLQVNVPEAQVVADGAVVGTTPLGTPLRFSPGTHTVVVSRAGYEEAVLNVDLAPGENVTERVKLLTEEEAAATRRAVQQADAKRRAAQEKLAREQAETRERRAALREGLQIGGWTSLSLGLTSAAVAGVFGLLYQSESNAVENPAPGQPWAGEIADHYDRADTFLTTAYWTVGIGGVLTVAGVVLTSIGYSITVPEAEAMSGEDGSDVALHVDAMVGPDVAGFGLRGRF